METIATYLQARSADRLVRDGIPAHLAARVVALHELCWAARVYPDAVFLDVDDQSTKKGWSTIRLGTNPTGAALEREIVSATA